MRHDRGVVLSSKVQLSLTQTFSACLRNLQMFWDSLFILLLVRKLKGKRWFQNWTCCKIYKTLAARYCSFLQYLPLQIAGLPLRPLASTLGCNASQSYFSSENFESYESSFTVNLNKKIRSCRVSNFVHKCSQAVSVDSQITASFRTWTATAVLWFSSWHMLAGRSGFRIPLDIRDFFFFTKTSRPAPGPTIGWVPGLFANSKAV